MTLFQNFTTPLWQLFVGNLLMLATCGCYIAWWSVAFGPEAYRASAAANLLLGLTLAAGLGAIVALFLGIVSLAQTGDGLPVLVIAGGAALAFVALLIVTQAVFHRPVTAELLLIIFWATLELAAVAVLRESGHFGPGQTSALSSLVGLAVAVGLVCYLLYYHLEGGPRFWDGLIPIALDAGVVAVFLLVLAIG